MEGRGGMRRDEEELIGNEFEYLGMRCRVVAWNGESIFFPVPPAYGAGDYPRVVRYQEPIVTRECISLAIASNGDIKTRTMTHIFAQDVRKEFVRQLEERSECSNAS